MNGVRSAFMSYDADYYRARAIEQRGLGADADRAEIAAIHRELAQQYDRLADECDGLTEQFEELAERASRLIKEQDR